MSAAHTQRPERESLTPFAKVPKGLGLGPRPDSGPSLFERIRADEEHRATLSTESEGESDAKDARFMKMQTAKMPNESSRETDAELFLKR